jgi:hypothetical protein
MLTLLSLWAFGEASFWFIAPDFLLIPLSWEHPKKWLKFSTIAWVSSILGGVFYFWWASHYFATAQKILEITPFVTPRMHSSISNIFQEHGAWGALFQSWSFMSFKIWSFEAIKHRLSFSHYFPIVVFSRIFRIFVVSWVSSKCSSWILPYWKKNVRVSWFVYSLVFLGGLVLVES